jgi:hypothetical protein
VADFRELTKQEYLEDKQNRYWSLFQPPRADDDTQHWSPLFEEIVKQVSYKPGYGLVLLRDQKDINGRWYYQVQCIRPDSETGELGLGKGGKAYLSPHMNKSELTRIAFGLFKAYEEHECREFFKWEGRAIFGPHVDSDALWEVAERFDYR